MPLNVTRVFIQTAADALANASLTKEKEEELCDKLVALCEEYAPDTFGSIDDEDEDDEEE